MQTKQKFCKNYKSSTKITKVLQTSKITKVLQTSKSSKSSANIAKVLQNLQQFYTSSANITKVLQKLQRFCKSTANIPKVLQTFQKFVFFHIFIHDYASPGLNLFNLVITKFVISDLNPHFYEVN